MSILDPNIDVNYGCLIYQIDIDVFTSLLRDGSVPINMETHRKMQIDREKIKSILEDWLNTRICCPASTEIKSILSQTLGIPKKVMKVRRHRCNYNKGERLHVFHDVKITNGTTFEVNGHRYELTIIHFNWVMNSFAPKNNYTF